jgi:hypothetical protein
MALTLKLVLGTVNYTDFLRVSAAKVSDPTNEIFVDYIDTPVSNYTLLIPDLDPDNYYITFRDTPDEMSLGTLVSQAFYNAQTGEFEYERRFYTIGALPGDVTVSPDGTVLTDPYLENKNVTGVFKENFRYLQPTAEYTTDPDTGELTLVGYLLSDGEKFIVEIKYNVGNSVTTTAAGLFIGTISVTDENYTISPSDKGNRFMLEAEGAKQVITLPLLSTLASGDFVYLEHKRSGLQMQSKIVTGGVDKILFNGFNIPLNELSELWVSMGKSLYLRKEGSYYEVIFDYDGTRVGERMAGTFKDHPNWLPEDGRLLDGDEYPALYWWIRNVLPNTHYITDDTVVSGGYTHPGNKLGQFVIHSTLKKFRMPNTQGMMEKGLKNFTTYGADANRSIDYPGGWQDSRNKKHGHRVRNGSGGSSTNPLDAPTSGFSGMDSLGSFIGSATASSTWVEESGGDDVWVQNTGVIYLRRI